MSWKKGTLLAGTATALALAATAQAPAGRPVVTPPFLSAPTATVVTTPVAQLLHVLQQNVLRHEVAVCLVGRVTADSTVIESALPALVHSAGPRFVNFSCPIHPTVIGSAHTHLLGGPIGCAASAQDMWSFGRLPHARVLGVVCTDPDDGRTVLVLYRKDSPIPSYTWYPVDE